MKYAEFINGNDNFQYSINLNYDLMNDDKIDCYIPTKKSIEILNDYLLSTVSDNKDNATVLVGPYGKGKSHLLLILIAILYGSDKNKTLNKLVDKIKVIDKKAGELTKEVLKNKKYLPLIINFNSRDLNQAFLIALKNALLLAGLEGILPNTYFNSAIDTINNWKDHPNKQMINMVEKLVQDKCGLTLKKFIDTLKFYNEDNYKIFTDIFKEVTLGIEFNPMTNSDIVKLIEETNLKLCEKYNYDGIIIVFDEFSKFIESSETINNSKDLKVIQDIAELSSRSKVPKLQIVCITHKPIDEYIAQIPKNKIDGWRTIEGRFTEKLFIASAQQNYELIANAIIKRRNKFSQYLNENKDRLNELTNECYRLFNGLYKSDDYEKDIVKNCFPLHPYTTYSLPIVSEKVAQNERTLFTYLSKNEHNALIEFINENNGELELVTLDKLYDYFEGLLKKDAYNKSVYNVWVQANTALKIVYSELERKIIKSLSIIYVVNQSDILTPNEYTIKHSLQESDKEIDSAIEALIQSGILLLRKGSETLDFLPISSVNVRKKIDDIAEANFKQVKYSKVYSEIIDLGFTLPKKYNYNYKITRFFKKIFMTSDELIAYSSVQQVVDDYRSDGVIINLIYTHTDEIYEVKKWINEKNDKRIIIVIPNKELDNDTSDLLSQYEATKFLKEDEEFLKQDKAIKTQLELLEEDIENKLVEYIVNSYDIDSENCTLNIVEKQYKFINSVKLSGILSDICQEYFYNTPVINNELINKNTISAPINKARDLIINMLLNNSYDDFDYNKNSAECTLFRATIVNLGLLDDNNNGNLIIDEIKNYVNQSETNELFFSTLYDRLISKEYGIGMRKGTIPIYLAYVLKDYKEDAILYLKSGRSKKEIILDSKLLSNINENPQKYCLKIEKGSVEKNEFISQLSEMFLQYTNISTTNKFINITHGMKAWLESLNGVAKNHKIDIETNENIPGEYLKFKDKFMKYELNYRDFIFNEIKKIFNCNDYEELINKLKKYKNYYDSYELKVKEFVIKKTNELFNKRSSGNLCGNIKMWFENIDENKKSHLYNTVTNEFIRLVYSLDSNEVNTINRLSKIVTGVFIEDWNDNTFSKYLTGLEEIISTILNYEVECEDDSSVIKIVLCDSNNKTIEKTFSKAKVSDTGSMMLNAIDEAIEEFGESVDDNEKRNIIMNILERYI